MASDLLQDLAEGAAPGDLSTRFIFVPHDDPEPLEWMAAHPGWMKLPATMVPRLPEQTASPPSLGDPAPRPWGRFPGGSPSDVPDGMRKPGEGVPAGPSHPADPTAFMDAYDHASRLIGAPVLTPPAAPGLWSGLGSFASHLVGIPSAAAQTAEVPTEPLPEAETGRRADAASEPLPPPLRLLEFRRAWADLRKIEPDNPALNTLSVPASIVPEQDALDRLEAELAQARIRQERRLQVDRARPEGFPDQASLQRFTNALINSFASAGVPPPGVGLIGSSVTGLS